jgi:hypothetical protein
MAGHKGQPHPRPIHQITANMIENVSIIHATHVRVGGRIEKIKSAWGISPEGRLATLSEGGLGVETESGECLEALKVTSFIQQVGTPTPPHRPALHPAQVRPDRRPNQPWIWGQTSPRRVLSFDDKIPAVLDELPPLQRP